MTGFRKAVLPAVLQTQAGGGSKLLWIGRECFTERSNVNNNIASFVTGLGGHDPKPIDVNQRASQYWTGEECFKVKG